MASKKTRILIADDHSVVRKGLAMVLQLEPGFVVVGEAGEGQQAVEMVRLLRPDLILLDRMMPGMNAFDTVKALRATAPETKVVILTGTNIDAGVLDLLLAGVDGYVFKDIEPFELKQAIRSVLKGEAYLNPAVARLMMNRMQRDAGSTPDLLLSPREMEVLKLLVTPQTYREIADQLHVSEETIRSHAKHILSKLGQPNRAQAVLAAVRLGLIEIEGEPS